MNACGIIIPKNTFCWQMKQKLFEIKNKLTILI